MNFDKEEFKKVKSQLKKDLIKEIGHCEECGYSRFEEILQIAHIKHGVNVESLNKSNVFLLCMNCHRAFDRGLIKVKGVLSDSQLSSRIKEMAKQNRVDVWKEDRTGKFRLIR